MQFPVASLLTGTALAAADGVVSSMDATAGRTTLGHQRTLWLQGGAAAAGLVGEFANWGHPDVTETLIVVSGALFTRAVAFHLAQSGKTPSIAQQGGAYRSFVAAPQLYPDPTMALGGGGRAWNYTESVGSL